MTDFLKLSWYLFKWAMVALGVMTAFAITWGKFSNSTQRERSNQMEWRTVQQGYKGCLFAFQTPAGKWVPDSQYASSGLIHKDLKSKEEPVFFSFERHWSGNDAKGGWFLPAARGCTLESKGTFKIQSGSTARMFIATNCPTKGDYYINYGTKHLLYGYVTLGEKSDYMWLASNDEQLLWKHEQDLKRALESHSQNSPGCVTTPEEAK